MAISQIVSGVRFFMVGVVDCACTSYVLLEAEDQIDANKNKMSRSAIAIIDDGDRCEFSLRPHYPAT